MSDHNTWLTEAQFGRIRPLLPNKVRGVPGVDDRRVIPGSIAAPQRCCHVATVQCGTR